MWFGWGFMFLGPLCLVLFAVAIYYVITSISHRGCCSTHTQVQQPGTYSTRAVEILKERYAKGEITKEQYLQMKDDLQ
jgi:putative membrane protein